MKELTGTEKMLQDMCLEAGNMDFFEKVMKMDGPMEFFMYGLIPELRKTPQIIQYIELSDSDDICSMAYKVILKKYDSEKKNAGGRISINNMDMAEIMFVMSEGKQAAFDVIQKAQKFSGNVVKERSFYGIPSIPPIHAMCGMIMDMDDMNIRGEQVLWADEYVDGDGHALCKMFFDRDKDMITYINQKMAEKIKMAAEEGGYSDGPMAVFSGGSSTNRINRGRWNHIDICNYEEFLTNKVDVKKKDYGSMDIYEHTDPETAIHIAEAHGFELQSRFDVPTLFGAHLSHIIMMNKKTGDFLIASASDDNICYGGCSIFATRNINVPHSIFPSDVGIRGNRQKYDEGDLALYDICYQNGGLFSQYEKLPDIDINEIDFSKCPVCGTPGLQIPPFVGDNAFYAKNIYIDGQLLDSYFIQELCESLVAIDKWKEWMTPDLEKVYRRWKEDPADSMFQYVYVDIYTPEQIEKGLQFASAYTGIDATYLEKPLAEYLKKNKCRTKKFNLKPSEEVREYAEKIKKER